MLNEIFFPIPCARNISQWSSQVNFTFETTCKTTFGTSCFMWLVRSAYLEKKSMLSYKIRSYMSSALHELTHTQMPQVEKNRWDLSGKDEQKQWYYMYFLITYLPTETHIKTQRYQLRLGKQKIFLRLCHVFNPLGIRICLKCTERFL